MSSALAFASSPSKVTNRLRRCCLGLTVIAPMAEILSCRSHDLKIGVSPHGAYVRRTVGLSKYPDSSRKASVDLRSRAFFYTREFFLLPAFDFGLITLPRLAFGLLAAPMQELAYYFPHVAFMVLNSEELLNQVRHALGSPQLVGPAVRFCPLPQKEFQFMKLRIIHLARCTGMRNGNQPVRTAACHGAPAVERATIHAENLGDLGMGLAALHQFDGADTASLEFFCCAEWSHLHSIGIRYSPL